MENTLRQFTYITLLLYWISDIMDKDKSLLLKEGVSTIISVFGEL